MLVEKARPNIRHCFNLFEKEVLQISVLFCSIMDIGYTILSCSVQLLVALVASLCARAYYLSGHALVHHSFVDFGDIPNLTTAVDVMLRLVSPEQIRGHFLRLLPDESWSSLVARLVYIPGEREKQSRTEFWRRRCTRCCWTWSCPRHISFLFQV